MTDEEGLGIFKLEKIEPATMETIISVRNGCDEYFRDFLAHRTFFTKALYEAQQNKKPYQITSDLSESLGSRFQRLLNRIDIGSKIDSVYYRAKESAKSDTSDSYEVYYEFFGLDSVEKQYGWRIGYKPVLRFRVIDDSKLAVNARLEPENERMDSQKVVTDCLLIAFPASELSHVLYETPIVVKTSSGDKKESLEVVPLTNVKQVLNEAKCIYDLIKLSGKDEKDAFKKIAEQKQTYPDKIDIAEISRNKYIVELVKAMGRDVDRIPL
jgi:hypothetical protein